MSTEHLPARAAPPGSVCALHRRHYPPPLFLELHHVQPHAMGGASTPENLAPVCATGHYNVHRILAALVFGTERPGGTISERRLAAAGYEKWIAAGKPGNPHAAYG